MTKLILLFLKGIIEAAILSDLQILMNKGFKNGKPIVEKFKIPFNIYSTNSFDSGDMSLKPFVVDWNGDGSDDIVFTGWSGDIQLLINKNENNKALFNKRKLLYQTPTIISVADSPTPEIIDWDSDGDLDLAVGNYAAPNQVYQNISGTLQLSWESAISGALQTTGVAWAGSHRR